MVEEGLIFAFEDAYQGIVQENSPLHQFIKLALDFVELGISKHFQEHFPMVRDVTRKVHMRLVKLATKKTNPLLDEFISQVNMQEEE